MQKHHILGDNYSNTVGKGIELFIDEKKIHHLGPNFFTFINRDVNTSPDIILTNIKIYHNHILETEPITASDHIPIVLTITAQAIKSLKPTIYNINKADWEKKLEDTIQDNIHAIIQIIKKHNREPVNEI